MSLRVACLAGIVRLALLAGCCTEDTFDGKALDGVAGGYDATSDRYLLGWWTLEHDSNDRELHLGSLDRAGVLTEKSVIWDQWAFEVIASNDGRHLATTLTEAGPVLSLVSTDGRVLVPRVLEPPFADTGGAGLVGRALDVEGGFLVMTGVLGAESYDLVLHTIDRDGTVLGSSTVVAGVANSSSDRYRPFYLSRAGDTVWIVYQEGSFIRARTVTASVAGPPITLTDDIDLIAVASAGDRILALGWQGGGGVYPSMVIRLDPAGAFTADLRPDLVGAGLLVAFPGAGYLTNGRSGDGVWLDLDARQLPGFAGRPYCIRADRSSIAGAGGDGLLLDCRRSFPQGDPYVIVTTMWADPIHVGGLPDLSGPVLLEFKETMGTTPLCDHGNG